MFSKTQYWNLRKNTSEVDLDNIAGREVVCYIIADIEEPRKTQPEIYATLADAEVGLKSMGRQAKKNHIRAEVKHPLSSSRKRGTLVHSKQPGDKHHAAGEHLVRFKLKGMIMVNRKIARQRSPSRVSSKKGYTQHDVNAPEIPKFFYPPEMTNRERMEWRRDKRENLAKRRREQRQKEAALNGGK